MNFADVEKDYLRKRGLPDFEWTSFAAPAEPNPLTKSIRQSRVAIVATAGAFVSGAQAPFITKSIHGDDSFRIIPNETAIETIDLAHPGYVTTRAKKNLDCVFPLALVNQFHAAAEIGSAAPRHASFMGFIPNTERLIRQQAPEVGRMLIRDGVDLVILVPS
jgi:D-proline reductase (dithiol) PrdB